MCYYARTDFSCGDWKWGNMMERCARQHRMGEVCGAKLVDEANITRKQEPCRTCQDIDVKKRRLQKLQDNIERWAPQGDAFKASLNKALGEKAELVRKIDELQQTRPRVRLGESVNEESRNTPSRSMLPSLTSQAESGFQHVWTSAPQAYSYSSQSPSSAGGYSSGSGGSRSQGGWQDSFPAPKPSSQGARRPR